MIMSPGAVFPLLLLLPAALFADVTVWFAPLDSLLRPEVGYSGSPQYGDLFQPDAPWDNAATRVNVFKIYPQWITRASDPELQVMFAELTRRNIAVALEFGVLRESAACGRSVEGFGGANLLAAARRVRDNGGVLRYIAMDEPIYFGNLYQGTNACRFSVAQLAANAALSIRELLAEFPDVQIGDIEPAPGGNIAAWADRYAAGIDALQTALGLPLAFFHADVVWSQNTWQTDVETIAAMVHGKSIPFGVIYNGNPDDASDAAWLANAEKHMLDVELGGLMPEHVVFQSWHAYPKKLLPETDSDSFTFLINRYFRTRTALTSGTAGVTLRGALTMADSTPIEAASVRAVAVPLEGKGFETTYHATGVVPAGATAIIFGARMNTECTCKGAANLSLRKFRYSGGAGPVIERDFSDGLQGWGVSNAALVKIERGELQVNVAENQTLLLNGPRIPLPEGSNFDFSVVATIAPGSAAGGYLTLIFLGTTEISRVRIALDPGELALGAGITDAAGAWEIPIPDIGVDQVRIVARFDGTDELWPARSAVNWRDESAIPTAPIRIESLSAGFVASTNSVRVTVTLNGPAPTGGVAVNLSSNQTAIGRATLLIPSRRNTGETTMAVGIGWGTLTATITASYSGSTQSTTLQLVSAPWTVSAGWASDPENDSVPANAHDLIAGAATLSNGVATLRARFKRGAFDPKNTVVLFLLDTDKNPLTGFPGIDPNGTDKGIIGSEFAVDMGSCWSTGTLFVALQSPPILARYGSKPLAGVTLPDGFDVRVPTFFLRSATLNFKLAAFNGCVAAASDILPNVGQPAVASATVTSAVAAPALLTPEPGASFEIFPRRTTLTWSAVPGAVFYIVQVDWSPPGATRTWTSDTAAGSGIYIFDEVSALSYTFDFVGAQPGRWRVFAVDQNGQAGPPSNWREFMYTR